MSTTLSDSSQIIVVYDTSSCGCSGGSKPLRVMTPTSTTDFVYSEISGQMTEVSCLRGVQEDTLRFEYDGSLPLSVEWAGAVSGRIDVSYNNDFRVISQSVNGSNTVNYNYDNDGLLNQAGDLTISHDPVNGMMIGTTLGNVTTGYDYNAYGELTEYSAQYNGSDVFRSQYHLDAVGRIDTLWENVLGKQNKFVYNYDISGRLEKVFRNDTLISTYSYDSNGNRLYHATLTDTVFGSYDEQDRMLSYGNSTYGYTANGSLKWKIECQASPHRDTTHYQYDLFGNLISVNLPNGDFFEYLIDAQNRRIGKVVNGQIVRKWLYQDQLNPVAELDGNDSLLSTFIYGSQPHVPDYMEKGGEVYKYVTDHLGSVRFLINVNSGDIVQEISYSEFGEVLFNTNPGFQPFAYAGGLYETQTKFTRFGVRSYSADNGRWTTKEPLGFNGGNNFYVYANNSPIMYTDPTGEIAVMAALAIAWAVAEVAMSAYDMYDYLKTVNDPCSSMLDVGLSFAGVAAGLLLPGGMYDDAGKAGVKAIKGYTKHGLNQAISREGKGVATDAILDAVRNPKKIVQGAGDAVKYIGENATVLLNEAGEVITTWARNSAGYRIK